MDPTRKILQRLVIYASPVHDVNGVRAPERIKAGMFAINGVSLSPVEKTIENGRKIVAFRTEKTVAAIRKAMAAGRAGNP